MTQRLQGTVGVVRVIARLNIGGPSIQAITLTKLLEPLGYRTTLVRGREGPREGNMDHLARALGVTPDTVSTLRRDPGWYDPLALLALVRIILRERPAVLHTHAAKGGTIGRLAAILAFPRRARRPVIIHTYHGHSLTGYFAPRKAALFRGIERRLASRTDCLIAVSAEIRDELVALGISERDRFTVIPLGFDLKPFLVPDPEREAARDAVRRELGISSSASVITLIARLVPIKRVDRFLRAAALVGRRHGLHFLIVGDGELRETLQGSEAAIALGDSVTWAGFRRDIPAICFASDVVVLCSDNEGTPVSLIEASAAGVPVVSTRVGGASTVVIHDETGILVDVDDEAALATQIVRLVDDPAVRQRMGAAGRTHAVDAFSIDRLVADVDALYRTLLAERVKQLSPVS